MPKRCFSATRRTPDSASLDENENAKEKKGKTSSTNPKEAGLRSVATIWETLFKELEDQPVSATAKPAASVSVTTKKPAASSAATAKFQSDPESPNKKTRKRKKRSVTNEDAINSSAKPAKEKQVAKENAAKEKTSRVPEPIKRMFGQIGFVQSKKKYFPGLIVNPFQAPKSNMRCKWMSKILRSATPTTAFLVFWYGELSKDKVWSIEQSTSFTPFDKTPPEVIKNFKNTIAQAERKTARGEKLLDHEAYALRAWNKMQEDFRKEPHLRRHGKAALKQTDQCPGRTPQQKAKNGDSESATRGKMEADRSEDDSSSLSFGTESPHLEFRGDEDERCVPTHHPSQRGTLASLETVAHTRVGAMDHARTYCLEKHDSETHTVGAIALGTRTINDAIFRERDNDYILMIDIPGVPVKDVIVLVDHNKLEISADRTHDNHKVSKNNWEISLNQQSMDASKIRASLVNGVLTILIPKRRFEQLLLTPVVGDPPQGSSHDSQFFSRTVDLPGVKPEDVQVTVNELDKVEVRAKRKVGDSYSEINRIFSIKDLKIDFSQIQLFLNFGVLTLVAVLKEESSGSQAAQKTVEVQSTDILDSSIKQENSFEV